jgi:FKBP-type peptidyl-prolyl cis-trans isomerase
MKLQSGIDLLSETEGNGKSVQKGDSVKVLLNGWLSKGDPVQTDYVENIVVGARKVGPGIECSLEGIKAGGVRKVKISPHLGYGAKQVEGIPSNAVLVYEIKVLGINAT